ncbi:mediator of RNA polymerase II transcription subunit 10-like [Mesoplodon densirostris]|uniref:mediator of RNA polymerase II transcription subunit 10-like n=1 Tax=Mesoplodon densirostris TaxID=48708 RepID=UPI0028DC732E|nr:mediator of RNA polymerase II transcription subunit 10-like [Mesoplodon densirostris]
MQGHRYQATYHLVDYDEVPTEASALGDHLAAALDSYGSKASRLQLGGSLIPLTSVFGGCILLDPAGSRACWGSGEIAHARMELRRRSREQERARGGADGRAVAEKFDHLEEHLKKFVENIRQLGIIVSDFQPSSQAGLNQKLNFIVTGLHDIDKCRQQLHDITVPLEVFEYIHRSRSKSPLYAKECLERALAKNEQVKGKIDTMKKFKSLLIQLSKVFPEDIAKYRSIRGEDHPPS